MSIKTEDFWQEQKKRYTNSYSICNLAAVTVRREKEIERLDNLINTPHLLDFSESVVLEACHQRERWSVEHDNGKTPADWFWLVGFLAGKALTACLTGNKDKALHHTISTSAALANWHAAIVGNSTGMMPGAEMKERE